MVEYTKKITENTTVRLLLLFLLPGILILSVVFEIQTNLEIRKANEDSAEIISFMKEQSIRYDEILTNNKMRIQMDLAEKATELKRCLSEQEMLSDKNMHQFLKEQRLTGILILDKNLHIKNSQYTEKIEDKIWNAAFKAQNMQDLLMYPEKVLSAQIEISEEKDYYYAAMASEDQKSIILCYESANTKADIENQRSIERILTGYKVERDGTVVLSDGEKVISSNDQSMQGKRIEDCPRIIMFNKKQEADTFIRVKEDGRAFWGSHAKYGQYYIYVFFPEKEIFTERAMVIAYAVAFYLAAWFALLFVHRKLAKRQLVNLEYQHNIIDAISRIYVTNYVVDLKYKTLEIIRAPEEVHKIVKYLHGAEQTMNAITSYCIGKEYQAGMREITDINTLSERLKGKESLNYTFQDAFGVWHMLTALPKRIQADGEIESVIFAVQNIDEQKRREQEYQNQIIETAEEARRANVAKTEFLQRMSHDIRTPINGVIGMLNIGDHFPEDMEKQRECREKIRGAAMFLFELVNDVLDMSKMESGEIELEKIPFDLREMLDEVVALIEVQAVERGIHFTYKRENYQHYKLIGSPVHLRQIMLNIAGNAVKYNRENGSLDLHCEEVSCSEKYAMYEFTCVDTGKGMSKEFQKHMFEPFTQEENGARTTLGGTGLGLSIVKKLVEKMNGEIDVVSEEGKGTTFTINLPLKINPDAVEEETSEKEEQELSIAGLHILLVEDNELNMEIAEFLLEDEGAVLTKAWNGQEAVDIFKNSPDGTFDVILMDIMMPVMDGLAATRTIRGLMREEAERIPIIAMTANAFEEDRKRSMEAGMNGHVAKPLDMQEILKTIVDCIQHK